MINELEDIDNRFDKWLKPEGDIGLNNFFSNPLHLSVKDDNTKNQAKDIVEQMVERQIHSEALFQSLDLMLKCDTTKKSIASVLTNSDSKKASFINNIKFDDKKDKPKMFSQFTEKVAGLQTFKTPNDLPD